MHVFPFIASRQKKPNINKITNDTKKRIYFYDKENKISFVYVPHIRVCYFNFFEFLDVSVTDFKLDFFYHAHHVAIALCRHFSALSYVSGLAGSKSFYGSSLDAYSSADVAISDLDD